VIDENFKFKDLISRFMPREICCDIKDDIMGACKKVPDHNLPCVTVASSNNVTGVITDRNFIALLGSADFLKLKHNLKC
jgi:hypothetical protein